MSQTVADVLVGTLEQVGVKHIFGLIGDSLNPLADAVRRSRIEWIGVRAIRGKRKNPRRADATRPAGTDTPAVGHRRPHYPPPRYRRCL